MSFKSQHHAIEQHLEVSEKIFCIYEENIKNSAIIEVGLPRIRVGSEEPYNYLQASIDKQCFATV